LLVSSSTNPHLYIKAEGSPQPVETDSEKIPALTDNGDGWWEASGLIYHGIPTRILFFLPSMGKDQADGINAAAWREFDRIGKIFNPFDPASEIARMNNVSRTGHSPMQMDVSQDVYTVMEISQDIWARSHGNFDPTVWPVKQLWRNAEKNQRIPSDQDIRKALQSMGFGKVRLSDDQKQRICTLEHPVMFDFGGIVKGYAVDQIRRMLLDAGVTAGLVQLGGEIAAFGNNENEPWRIGIQHPIQMGKVWGVIEAKGSLRVSTSGNYRQAIQIGNRSFYHIFSPKTGWPVSEKVMGVTTSCMGENTSSARLDGIATAITVLGPKNGLALAENLSIDALILYEAADGGIREIATKGMTSHYMRENRYRENR
jgi:thiamine biosynthesis lipoprotein